MTIHEMISEIQDVCLLHKQIRNVQVGNNFDIATSKSSEIYPCVWLELPILTNYVDGRRKTHSLSINFLTLTKHDNIDDVIAKTSDMEVVADEVLQAIDDRFTNIGINDITALTLRGFSDDDLSGVRVELTFTVGRECDYRTSFKTPIE